MVIACFKEVVDVLELSGVIDEYNPAVLQLIRKKQQFSFQRKSSISHYCRYNMSSDTADSEILDGFEAGFGADFDGDSRLFWTPMSKLI